MEVWTKLCRNLENLDTHKPRKNLSSKELWLHCKLFCVFNISVCVLTCPFPDVSSWQKSIGVPGPLIFWTVNSSSLLERLCCFLLLHHNWSLRKRDLLGSWSLLPWYKDQIENILLQCSFLWKWVAQKHKTILKADSYIGHSWNGGVIARDKLNSWQSHKTSEGLFNLLEKKMGQG